MHVYTQIYMSFVHENFKDYIFFLRNQCYYTKNLFILTSLNFFLYISYIIKNAAETFLLMCLIVNSWLIVNTYFFQIMILRLGSIDGIILKNC